MNLKVSPRALRAMACAGLVLASAGVYAQSSSQQPVVAAPGTKPMAAPGTAAARGAALQALAPNQLFQYDNKWDIYGGLLYANGQAGQNLPKHYNMGGGEVMGTYWLGGPVWKIGAGRLGLAADYRIQAGTTPVLPTGTVYGWNRILAYQNIISGGVQYRVIRNRYMGVNLHALAGASHGTFDSAVTGYPKNTPYHPTVDDAGVYSNRTTPWGTWGASMDFNYSPKVAIRLQPDMVFEHFGTETREFFGISAGVVYHLGKRK